MNNKRKILHFGFWILLSEVTGLFSALLSLDGMRKFADFVNEPPFTPSPIIFVIVWFVLYASMGIGAALVSKSDVPEASAIGLNLFITQLILNFFWSPIFFNTGAFGFSFIWLIALLVVVVYMKRIFSQASILAGKLQLPYVIWLCIAGYLNLGVWFLNQ